MELPQAHGSTVLAAEPSTVAQAAIAFVEHFFKAALQNMVEAVHATPLQTQGLSFAVVPAVKVHALAAKQMHFLSSLHAVVEVG